ncbi:hypothetical protein V2J09_007394 [Rumex salicifolius]
MSSSTLHWLSLVGMIWLQSINGTNTNFPAYSSQLKQLLSLSQLQLNSLASASDAGKLFGWFSGLAALYLPLWLVLMIGSALGLIGYGVQYLFVIRLIPSLSYWSIFSLNVLAGNSICWINTVCYVVAVKNFPLQLQAAVGITTSYSGLSAVVYTAVVDAFLSGILGRAQAYLLLNSVFPIIVSVITAALVRSLSSRKPQRSQTGFVVISIITVGTGLYALSSSLSSTSGKLPPIVNVAGIGLCLALPLVVPLCAYLRATIMEKRKLCMNADARVCHLSSPGVDVENRMKWMDGVSSMEIVMPESRVAVMEEISAGLMLKRLSFWLYFFVYFLGGTLGLVFGNNLGQIAQSRGCSRTSSLVSLSSAFSFFGRLLPCLLHYICPRSGFMVSCPASIVSMMVPLSGAFFLLLHGSTLALYVSTSVIGVCTGAIATLCVLLTTHLFGANNFGVNHNIVVANIPIGSFLFGGFAAFLYQKEAGGDDNRCFGLSCYRNTFIIWGSLCSFGTLLALILHIRTRKFYFHKS